MITNFDSIILEYFKDKRLCGATTAKFLSMYKEINSYLEQIFYLRIDLNISFSLRSSAYYEF